MGKLRPFVRKDSYMPNKKWIPFVIGNGYTTTDGASGPAPKYETVTGNPVTFSAKAAPLKQLSVAFAPVQAGTGDPSPTNVRPISGWDSLNVWQTGQNMFNIAELLNATGWTETDGVYSGTSKNLYATFKLSSGGFIQFPQGASERIRVYYYCHATSEGTRFGIEFSYTDGTTSNYRPTTTTEDTWYTAISTSGKTVDAVGFYYGSSGNVYVSKFGIFVYDADKTAEDYNYAYNPSSRSISITLGSTVYSGTVDVVTGVLKVRPYFASYNGETLVGPWMSSMDKYVAGATPTVGAQVVDMGGAETTIQLTPQEVESLLGGNTMWSDANGDLTVTYAVATATTPIVGTGKVGQAVI